MADIIEIEEEQKRKRLTCPLCKCIFPTQEFYDSHHVIEAKHIADMLYEEFPTFIDAISKIDEKKREGKEIERKIKFIEETRQREAKFRQEQQQSEIKFIEEEQRRESKNKRIIEKLKSCYAAGLTPDTEALYRLVSED